MDASPAKKFQKEIVDIDRAVVDLTAPGDLFRYPFFIEVYENPTPLVGDVIEILQTKNLSDQQKIISVLMMQRLPAKEWLSFGESVLSLLEGDSISEEVFEWALFPGHEWNQIFAMYYRKRAVKRLLEKIAGSEKVTHDLKSYVQKEVLTGEAKKEVRRMKDRGEIS